MQKKITNKEARRSEAEREIFCTVEKFALRLLIKIKELSFISNIQWRHET